MKRGRIPGLVLLFAAGTARAQEGDATPMAFGDYMERVESSSLAAVAERASVPIAEAERAIARARPNPFVSFGLAQLDVSGQGAPTASYLGFTTPIELGGKRRLRLALADADVSLAESTLSVTFLRMRQEAALAYVDALEADLVLDRLRLTLAGLERLVEVNQHRFQSGDIGETALVQSRVEASRFRADELAAEGDVDGARIALAAYVSGEIAAVGGIAATGSLEIPVRTFDEDALVRAALDEHPILQAMQEQVDRADRAVDLAQGQRIVDAQLVLGWTHNASTNEAQFRQHSNDVIGATLVLPMPFANRHRGPLRHAEAELAHTRLVLEAERLRRSVDVRRSIRLYRAAAARLAVYREGLLAEADRVLESVLYEYQRGDATLLEVLNAERTANEVHIGYTQALAEHARALVRIEIAAGIWDVSL